MYYKIISNDGIPVDVLCKVNYTKEQKNGIRILCEENDDPDGVLSFDSSYIYPLSDFRVSLIDKHEYDELYKVLHSTDESEEILELKGKVAELENALQDLILLFYGGDS